MALDLGITGIKFLRVLAFPGLMTCSAVLRAFCHKIWDRKTPWVSVLNQKGEKHFR